jgi:hypothetical protein
MIGRPMKNLLRCARQASALLLVIAATASCDPHVDPITGIGGGSTGSSATEAPTVWNGYIENYQFDDGSDALSLTIDAAGGHVTFGTRAAYPPPTDPNVGYPPGYMSPGIVPTPFLTGFSYTMLNPSLSSTRIQFSVDRRELWTSWCELQTPIEDSANPGNYGCLPNASTAWSQFGPCKLYPGKPTEMIVDCMKLELCLEMPICTCAASACDIPPPIEGDIGIDIALNGSHGDGSIVGIGVDAVYNIHFDRQ